MTATTGSQNGRTSTSADAPRVLLFGLPGGGKTALLGALGRVTEIQERILGCRITDVSLGLRHLREQLYSRDNYSRPDSSVSYPVQVHPFVEGRPSPTSKFDVQLLDYNSRDVASIDGSAKQVFQADAILFVLDASGDDRQVEADCQHFSLFLQRFRKERGRRTDESKLPVWLVLAKCDRLARPGDNLAVWTERIEMRKEEATQRFNDVLDHGPKPSFGTLNFTATATGVRLPLLTNALAREDEPFGVAELFRDAIGAAKSYRDKKAIGELNIRRLVTAVGLAAAAVLLFAVLTPILRNAWKPSAALTALTAYRNSEKDNYLSEPLDSRIDQIRDISRQASFGKLSASDQSFVNDRLEELERYRNFAFNLKHVGLPTEARNLAELKQMEDKLHGEAAPPDKYAKTWAVSDAGRNHDRMTKQVGDLRSAVTQSIEQLDAMRQECDKLFVLPEGQPKWPEWETRVGMELAAAEPGIDASASSFAEVETAQKRWSASRKRLATFRDIAHALGMVPGVGQTLIVNREFKVAQSTDLLATLIKEHPRAITWATADVPDAALADVKAAAKSVYEQFLPSGRAAIVAALGSPTDGPESPARWRTAVESVQGNPAMKSWNELARIALRLAGDNADPLSELSTFLRQEEFSMVIPAIDLVQTADGSKGHLTPTGSLILFVQSAQGQVAKKAFRSQQESNGSRIQFIPADAKPIMYRPGSLMWAEIGVTDSSKADLQLTWWANGVRSKLFQFDRLTRPPRLHRIEQRAEEGRVINAIRLEISPPGALPRLPDLLPEDTPSR